MSDDLRLCASCQRKFNRVYAGPVNERPPRITPTQELAVIERRLDEMGVPRGDAYGLWRVSYRLQFAQDAWTRQVQEELMP